MARQLYNGRTQRGGTCYFQGQTWVCVRPTEKMPPHADWQPVSIPDDSLIVPGPTGPEGKHGLPGAESTVPGPAGNDSTVPGPTGPQGAPGLVWRGLWSRFATYNKGEAVTRDGSSYVANRETTREPSANSRHWDLLAARGASGPAGKNETTYIKHGSPRLVSAMAEIAELKEQLLSLGGSVATHAVFDSNTSAGEVVYVSGDGHVDLAQANGEPQALAVGIATADVVAGQTGEYIPVGPVSCDTWNLVPGNVYYLDPDRPGGMTNTFPNTIGNHVVILGAAATSTQLNLKIDWAIVIGS